MPRRKSKNKRMDVLAFIDSYKRDHRWGPTVREIGDALKIKSTSNVEYYLDMLSEDGLIDRPPRKSRTLCVTAPGMRLLSRSSAERRASKPRSAAYINITAAISMPVSSPMISIPVSGRTFGGALNTVFSSDFSVPFFDSDSILSVPQSFLPRGIKPESLFALEVCGDSMIDANINDGDHILVAKADGANPGDLAVVWLEDENETTLKYFYPEQNQVRLEPANPKYPAILLKPPRMKCLRILGKVILVVR